jgi:hypothetical protein
VSTSVTYLDHFAASLVSVLEQDPLDDDDVVALATAGERLRRAVHQAEHTSVTALEALARYDGWLAAPTAAIPLLREVTIAAILADLRLLGATPSSAPSTEEAEALVDELDSAMMLVAMGLRAGRIALEEALGLADRVRHTVTTELPHLSRLATVAERRLLYLGPDPDYPELDSWLDVLATAGPVRIRTELMIAREVRRVRLIDEVLADSPAGSIARTRARAGITGLVAGLREALDALAPLRVHLPQQIAAAYQDRTGLPREENLIDIDGLRVSRFGMHLVCISTGPTLEIARASLDEASLPPEQIDATIARVALPARRGRLGLTIRVGGEEITMPPIELGAPP